MNTWVLASMVALAGFLMFPAVIGFFTTNRGRQSRLGVALVLWSCSVALLLLATVGLLTPQVPASWLGVLLTARHVLLFVTIMALFLVIHRLVGWLPRVLVGAIVVLLLVRAYLWLFTDLTWAHRFLVDGTPVYGPLRNPLALLVTLLTAAVVIAAAMRPWRSAFERRAIRWAILPGTLCALAGSLLPGGIAEVFVGLAQVPPLLAVEFMYLVEFRRQNRRTELLADRERRLVEFGVATLATPGVPPHASAVTLIFEVLHSPGCAFVVARDGAEYLVAMHGSLMPSADMRIVSAPVGAAGSEGELRAVVHQDDNDDTAFLEATAFIVTAAMHREQLETELRRAALHDTLTELSNWALLEDRLTRLLRQPGEPPVAVLCCDINDLQGINDEYGHPAGDAVLRTMAARLQRFTSVQGTAARIGSDQFIVAEPGMGEGAARALADQIVGDGILVIPVGDRSIGFDVRVGIAVGRGPGAEADRLVRDAELAMRRAKRDAVTIAAFSDLEPATPTARRRFSRELQQAVENGEISLQYQPIVDLRTGTIEGVEALARWRNSSGEQVPPLEFIRVAENTGLILVLGEHILRTAIRQLADWSRDHPALQQLRLSINLAPRQLRDATLPGKLADLLTRYGVEPMRVTLEVTETGLDPDPVAAADHLTAFREMGLGVSLDDFGTGWSTLERLTRLPVTELKIDRQFVTVVDGSAQLVVPAVVGLAHGFGLAVVAEGVEMEEQRQLVLRDGCDRGQGFLFGRPLDAADLPIHQLGALSGRALAHPSKDR